MIKDGVAGILGSKTGYLHESLYCLMTRIKTKQGNILVINLGSDNKENRVADNKKINRIRFKCFKLKI